MKTALKIFAAVLFVVFAAIVTVPFFIDVDKSRPLLVKEVNEKINGKVELGQLKLSLWGGINFKAAGLKLTDAGGKEVLAVKDVLLNIPFLSFLTGAPRANFELNEPSIHVVHSADGSLNLMSILKKDVGESTAGSVGAGTQAKDAGHAAGTEGPVLIPPILMNARLTLLINHAKLDYSNLKTKEHYNVSDFSFALHDVSPSSRMPFDVVAVLGLELANGTKVNGPLKLNGALKANGPAATPFDSLEGSVNLVMDELDIIVPGQMSKRPGVTLSIETTASLTKDAVNISKLVLKLADVAITGTASANLTADPLEAQVAIESNQIDIEKLGSIFPAITKNQLNGKVKIKANAQGPASALRYSAEVDLAGMTTKPAGLAETLTVQGKVVVATNELKSMTLDLSAPSLKAKLTGSVQDFTAPRFSFNFHAEDTNLDKLLVKQATSDAPTATESKAAGGAAKPSKSTAAGAATQNLNSSFEPLKKTPLLAKSSGTFTFNIKNLVASRVHMRDVKGKLSLANLVMRVDDFAFKAFDGAFKTDFSIDMKPAKPIVGLQSQITGMRTEKMVESQMTFAKNTMSGVFSGKLNLGGSGLNRDEINQWRGSGEFSLSDAKFASLEIGRQINEGLIQKLPDLIKSRIHVSERLASWKGEYKTLSAKFSMDKGTLSLPEITGVAAEGKGLDLKGSGRVSITDYTMDVSADFIDRQGMLGSGYPKDRRYNVPAISTRVTGSLYDPKFDWTHTISELAKNTAQDAVKQKASEALKKQAEKIKAPEAVKGLLKGLFR